LFDFQPYWKYAVKPLKIKRYKNLSTVLKLSKFCFYSPTDAQVKCLKSDFKIYTKTALTCFCAVTPSTGRALFVLAKVYFNNCKFGNALSDDGVTAQKHVRAVLM
jgi:hypothetical protein